MVNSNAAASDCRPRAVAVVKDEARRDRGEYRQAAGPAANAKARLARVVHSKWRASQGEKMQKWEYNLLVQSPNTECARCEEALNGLGRDGWELVTFYVNGAGDNVFVLKKPKE
jgi:hypothetical protein